MADPTGADWRKLYEEMLAENDVDKLREKVALFENAVFLRSQELERMPHSEGERAAIREATKELLKVQVEKLGFPTSVRSRSETP